MNLQTEVYVSLNGDDFYKLDLTQNESIEMKYVLKDTSNLSKIFAPYSLSFTFPGTLNNQRRLGFIGNVKVQKTNTSNALACKIYSNGTIFQTGKLSITEVREEMGRVKTFTGNFASTMIDLQTVMGDDVLTDLSEPIEISWLPNDVYNSIKSVQVHASGCKFYTPLISNTRIFQRQLDPSETYLDNVAYLMNPSAESNGTLKSTEFRPAIQGRHIIDLIKTKYNLEIEMPLEDTAHYNDWYIYCNSEFKPVESKQNTFTVDFINPFTLESLTTFGTGTPSIPLPTVRKYPGTIDLVNDVFSFTIDQTTDSQNIGLWGGGFTFQLIISGISALDGSTNSNFIITLRRGDDFIISSESYSIVGNQIVANVTILNSYFVANSLDFTIEISPQSPSIWQNMAVKQIQKFEAGLAKGYKRKTWIDSSLINDNSNSSGGYLINLLDLIPETKVSDFLNSFFKVFNISVFDASPTDNKLYWLTPKDLLVTNKLFSKKVLDYTPYVVSKNVDKKSASDFNYFNFKHADSKYKSNVDYEKTFKVDFGQLKYPSVKPTPEINEFKVETIFSLLPTVPITGMLDEFTSYGFTSDAPEVLDSGENRYTPNYDELTIFFNAGLRNLSDEKQLAFQKTDGATNLITASLNSYIKTSATYYDIFSFGFSLIQEAIASNISLYNDFYQTQTERLLSPNTLQHAYELELPASELVLNFNTTIQGQSQIPKGFRLQNEIVIQDNRFSIIDSTIDITTGKTKINLLNF